MKVTNFVISQIDAAAEIFVKDKGGNKIKAFNEIYVHTSVLVCVCVCACVRHYMGSMSLVALKTPARIRVQDPSVNLVRLCIRRLSVGQMVTVTPPRYHHTLTELRQHTRTLSSS